MKQRVEFNCLMFLLSYQVFLVARKLSNEPFGKVGWDEIQFLDGEPFICSSSFFPPSLMVSQVPMDNR